MRRLSNHIFTETNAVHSAVSAEEYERAEQLRPIVGSFVRTSYQSVFIIDFYKKNYFYVPECPLFLSDVMPSDFQREGLSLFLDRIPRSEVRKLFRVCQSGFELFYNQPTETREQCVICYDFHLLDRGRRVMVHHKLTPFLMTKDNELWMILCVVSLSPQKTAGHAIFRNKATGMTWSYSFDTWQWDVENMAILSQDEKKLLAYSAQGHSREAVGRMMGKSVDTIKLYRRRLFEKLGVDNITEAVSYASAYGLI